MCIAVIPASVRVFLNHNRRIKGRNCDLSTDGLRFAVYIVNRAKLGGMKAECSFVPVELSSLNRQPSIEPLAACFFNDSGMLARTDRYKFCFAGEVGVSHQ